MVAVAECGRVAAADVPRAPPVVSDGRRRPCLRARRRVAHALSSAAAVVKPDARLAQCAVAVGVRRTLAGCAGPRRRHPGREMIRIPICFVAGDSDRQHSRQPSR